MLPAASVGRTLCVVVALLVALEEYSWFIYLWHGGKFFIGNTCLRFQPETIVFSAVRQGTAAVPAVAVWGSDLVGAAMDVVLVQDEVVVPVVAVWGQVGDRDLAGAVVLVPVSVLVLVLLAVLPGRATCPVQPVDLHWTRLDANFCSS